MVDAQILSITCDNTSNNDTMIAELANLLDDFPGAANQTWCFTYILNLIVKSVIQQFDSPKSKGNKILDDVAKELLSLAGNIEFKEDELAWRDGKEGEEGEDDNIEGWIDKCTLMTDVELEELDESIEPVHLLLMMVSLLANTWLFN